jgi:hypothetical protein
MEKELKEYKKALFGIYKEDGREEDAFIDDCFLHIVRNGLRFTFYNGQVEKEVESLPIFGKQEHLNKAIEVVEELLR